jgi:pyridoxine 4-dehydrogenase
MPRQQPANGWLAVARPRRLHAMIDVFRLGGDLEVHRLGFGAMRLPSQQGMFGPARDPEASRAVLRRAVELGVDHIDTADFYVSAGMAVRANDLIREALQPYPSNLVIATKVGPLPGPGGLEHAAPTDMRGLVEANLAGLGVDRLDLVYLRVGIMSPPHGESIAARFEALAALQEEGLIRHLGISNVDLDHLAEARAIAPVAAVQNEFHADKRDDAAMLVACEESGIAFVPFFPIGGGRDLDDPRLAKVAARHGVSVTQVGLAWLLASSPVTLAIPGTGSVGHLEENQAADSIVLTDEDLADLA